MYSFNGSAASQVTSASSQPLGLPASKVSCTISSAVHKLEGTTNDCISCVRFSPIHCPIQLVGVTSWDSSCSVWQLALSATGSVESKPSWTTNHDGPLLDMSFSHDGRAFFGGCTKTAVMWDMNSGSKSVVATHDLPISCLAYLSATQAPVEMLVTGGWDGKLRWWDLRQQSPVKEENLYEPIFSLDGQRSMPMMGVATGRLVHIYNLQTMQKAMELKPPEVMKFNFRRVSCSPQTDGVVVGSSEGRVSFIPLDEKPGCTFKAHIATDRTPFIMHQTNMSVHHPLAPIMISAGGDGRICSWDRAAKKALGAVECAVKHENEAIPISSGDISANGTLLAYAHSYDWAMGKAGFKNQPSSVFVRRVDFTA